MQGNIEHVKCILDSLSANSFTLTSFLSIIFTLLPFQLEMQQLEIGILSTVLSSPEADVVRNWVLKSAESIYISEVQTLLGKECGLWMAAYKLHVEQLEEGKISSLKPIYQTKSPELWKLCH